MEGHGENPIVFFGFSEGPHSIFVPRAKVLGESNTARI
jgi:hypothetical protein